MMVSLRRIPAAASACTARGEGTYSASSLQDEYFGISHKINTAGHLRFLQVAQPNVRAPRRSHADGRMVTCLSFRIG